MTLVRNTLAALLLATPVALAAQTASAPVPDSTPVPPGIEVERVELNPGDATVFTFRQGKVHRLLDVKAEGEKAMSHMLGKGELRVSLSEAATGPTLTVENGTATDLKFNMITDFNGDGAFTEGHDMTVKAGASVQHPYKRSVVAVNVGNFDSAS